MLSRRVYFTACTCCGITVLSPGPENAPSKPIWIKGENKVMENDKWFSHFPIEQKTGSSWCLEEQPISYPVPAILCWRIGTVMHLKKSYACMKVFRLWSYTHQGRIIERTMNGQWWISPSSHQCVLAILSCQSMSADFLSVSFLHRHFVTINVNIWEKPYVYLVLLWKRFEQKKKS